MTEPTNPDERWPEWLEPLRPDDVARARILRAVRARAGDELARRRRSATWDAAERFARRLVPLAAAAVLVFGWLALRARPEPEEARPVAVEQLLEPPAGEGPPAFLVSASAPRAEHAYRAAFEPGTSP